MGRHSEGSDSPYNHLKAQERGMRSLGRGRLDREILGGWVRGDGKADREQKNHVTYHSTHFQHQPRS